MSCLLLAVAALLLGPRPRTPSRSRAGPGRRADAPRQRTGSPPQALRRLLAGSAAVATAVTVGGIGGLAAGGVLGYALYALLQRLEPAAARRLRSARTTQLPVALDLLAVCLRGGTALATALETVGGCLGGPLGADLVQVAALQSLGADAVTAWTGHQDDPVLGPVVRLVRRSAASGSALAAAFERYAADRRSAAIAAGEARAGRVAVVATAPLGLCFLPAFVCLAVVPMVVSVVTSAHLSW